MFDFVSGELPLLISFPHSSVEVPPELAERMTPAGRRLPDTDWFVPRLYDIELAHRASRIAARFSRYVIDVNRPPDGANLYRGRPTPELCPLTTFAGEPIWQAGDEPDETEIQRRRMEYWQPYHARVEEELRRLQHLHGVAVLFDAHSIRSEVPRLFDGRLPDLNIGTAEGHSCDSSLQTAMHDWLRTVNGYTGVINGRFVGGYLTRHFGQPENGIHAVQLELSQATYMNEQTGEWHDTRAEALRPVLAGLLATIIAWTR